MAGTETLQDLIRALEDHPDWRPRLLQVLLTEEFLEIPARIRHIEAEIAELRISSERHREETERLRQETERLRQETERLRQGTEICFQAMERAIEELAASPLKLAESHRELAASHRELAASHRELAKTVNELTVRVSRVETKVDGLTFKVDGIQGQLRGEKYEREKRDSAFYIFRGGRDFRLILEKRLREAFLEGRINQRESVDLRRLDVLWEKKPRGSSQSVVFAAEVSIVVDGSDVQRAYDRAIILSKLVGGTYTVVPIVIGDRLTGEDALDHARRLDVARMIGDDEPEIKPDRVSEAIRTPPMPFDDEA